MARIRSVKPELFFDVELAELEIPIRYLFIGLFSQSDRDGKGEDIPKKLKANIFPYDDLDIEPYMKSLTPKFITRYKVNEKRYYKINAFSKHQRPHHTEKPSEIPDPIQHITDKTPLKDGDKPPVIKEKEAVIKGKEMEMDNIPLSAVQSVDKGKVKAKKPPPEGFQQCMDLISKRWLIRGAPVKIDGEHGKIVKRLLNYGVARAQAILALFASRKWQGWGKDKQGLCPRALLTDLPKLLDSELLPQFEKEFVEPISKGVLSALPQIKEIPPAAPDTTQDKKVAAYRQLQSVAK